MTRYPVQPLLDAAGIRGADWAAETAFRLGISRRQVHRCVAQGLSWTQADRFACRLGHHPLNVWPEWTSDPVVPKAVAA